MPIKWIAEISSNHNKSWRRTLKLIREAKEIGCDAVKFQLFNTEKLYAPEFKTQINKMRKWALPRAFIPEIKNYCNGLNIEFGCSVFDLESLDFVKDYVDWLKIGSYELLYTDLIEAVIKTEKPWILSTGMENFNAKGYPNFSDDYMKNIRVAFWMRRECHEPASMTILYCNSNYPSRPKDCNLYNIKKIMEYFPGTIGWSDHTVEPGTIYKAITLGAEVIEFHFDLNDRKGFESEIGHCWQSDKIAEVIRNVKIGEIACQKNDTNETEARKWRTCPSDGLRPLQEFRKELLK